MVGHPLERECQECSVMGGLFGYESTHLLDPLRKNDPLGVFEIAHSLMQQGETYTLVVSVHPQMNAQWLDILKPNAGEKCFFFLRERMLS